MSRQVSRCPALSPGNSDAHEPVANTDQPLSSGLKAALSNGHGLASILSNSRNEPQDDEREDNHGCAGQGLKVSHSRV